MVGKSKIGIFGIFTGRNGRSNMHRMEAEALTLGNMFMYLNDDKMNPHDELLKDFSLLLKTHREYINGLSHSEYQEYKRKRNAKLNQN